MKHFITAILLAMLLAPLTAEAQAPRIRTSAPPEKTAQPQGAKPSEAAAGKTTGKAARPSAAKTPANVGKKKEKAPAAAQQLSQRFMAVKTNVAYDAFAILNAEFEIQVARKLSVDIPVIWSLWDWKQDLGLRVVAVQPEVRYWFGSVGKGSAVGVNLGLASYNFRKDGIRYQNISGRPLVSAAVSYTYSLSIDARWNAEFSLAVGYANMKYNRYYNIDNGAFINTRTRNYFGPTKVGITLSYRLGK